MITWLMPILAIGGLIFVHELGHFWAARLMGVRVDEFSVGFPPRIFSKKIGHTRYSLGIIFLGGFVKLRGQNLDDEDPTKADNYAAKSKLARLFIIAAGPAINLALAFILMPIAYKIGFPEPTYLSNPPIIEEVLVGSLAEQAGFKSGEQIISVNDEFVGSWREFSDEIAKAKDSPINVKLSSISSAGSFVREIEFSPSPRSTVDGFGLSPLVLPVIGQMISGWPAKQVGFMIGDKILKIDEIDVATLAQLSKEIQKKQGSLANYTLERSVDGSFSIINIKAAAKLDEKAMVWRLGFFTPNTKVTYSWSESINLGVARVINLGRALLTFFNKLFHNQVSKNEVGGPIMIVKAMGEAAEKGFSYFIILTAFISFQLGIFNLLPLPVLDGGHIAFLGYELVAGKQPSVKFRYGIQLVSVVLLLGLMLFITIQDILNF
ncbi:MAG: RIP metalloprotease RseP [SAR324 cluster bacterium]|nr:RIP metalloprotease RseP [SAR324 cluster bacterium]